MWYVGWRHAKEAANHITEVTVLDASRYVAKYTTRQAEYCLAQVPLAIVHYQSSAMSATNVGAARTFVKCFPDANAWHLTVLDRQKNCITDVPSMPTHMLRTTLPHTFGLRNVHVFIRPLLSNLIFLDLDKFHEHNANLDELLLLRPRAVTRTSENNLQGWFTIPDSLPSKEALWVTSVLTAHFTADTRSERPTQQGRFPGSINVKPGKDSLTILITQSPGAHLNEEAFIKITPRNIVRLEGDKVSKCVQKSSKKPSGEVGKVDTSGKDWKLCCEYWEQDGQRTLEMGLEELPNKLKQNPQKASLV